MVSLLRNGLESGNARCRPLNLAFAGGIFFLLAAVPFQGSAALAEENGELLPQKGNEKAGPVTAEELLQVPVGQEAIGGVSNRPSITSPVANDPNAAERGMRYFIQFNCVGCHADNGAGGMGPSLSNSKFLYGSAPENIYLTIVQGRAKGMPSWAGRIPDDIIWDIVAYIRSISSEPSTEWGKTISANGFTIQQVPAEYLQTASPWKYTMPFSYGQKPYKKPENAPPPTPQQGQ